MSILASLMKRSSGCRGHRPSIIAAGDELALGDESDWLLSGFGSQLFPRSLDMIINGIVTTPEEVSWPGAEAD
ncbi:hypothetical protein [Sphingomonas sp. S2-65]|uniref:hypothetical protein n=1 Tax=Sphingomonas sp. S2-65 TaxID=2903960 RepID=UPI001F2975AB|nr:hypothetical protein [Sphingomonas sp. S2-65]UYY56944.1 hypothetical protein LZ586_09570 [Sphingomonas sp. S2-65]